MKDRLALENNRLRAAIAVCIYFCFILLVFYFKLEFQFIRVIGELLTIPALLALVFIPIWALIDGFRKKNKKQSTYILTLLVSLITMVLLLLTNFFSS
ncbi:hypothetical protein [Lacinutrix sp.]|uniref:hypothetical protein n=1 Tax=Lacinutrix sp. TaxID=1937692 RepID=UPI00261DC9D2|nr:hypothetical protein [Lacinutrix sp.]MDG1715608.1 hypothetical protein [Lacinutrix sp.]